VKQAFRFRTAYRLADDAGDGQAFDAACAMMTRTARGDAFNLEKFA